MDKATVSKYVESAYTMYHFPKYIYPDPLFFVRQFSCTRVREIGGLIIALLAMGNVTAMLKSLDDLLSRLTFLCRPAASWDEAEIRYALSGFGYRFFKEKDLFLLIDSIQHTVTKYGSLEAAFLSCLNLGEPDIIEALGGFTDILYKNARSDISFLLPSPRKGSACKRLFLYLRWMVRKDEIDPGGWDFDPALLLVPVDTHILKTGRILGFTNRKQADLKTAREITEGFRRFCPEDPVRYDFSITRIGIHPRGRTGKGLS
jgi:uncharacterized protein (TIGR02757 family)